MQRARLNERDLAIGEFMGSGSIADSFESETIDALCSRNRVTFAYVGPASRFR